MMDPVLRLVPAVNDFGAAVRWPGRALLGRCALVTRSTGGLGLAIARALAAEGSHVMLNGLSGSSETQDLRAGMASEHRVRVAFCAADPVRPVEAVALVRQAQSELGSVDILVNCPGVHHAAPTEQLPRELWDAVLAANLSCSFHTMRAALPAMRARNWGRIVNVACAEGLAGIAADPAWVAAQHGLVGLTRAAGLEYARNGVTCNAICPGHDCAPDQVGAAVVSVCGAAAAEMRGAVLCIDGGLTAA